MNHMYGIKGIRIKTFEIGPKDENIDILHLFLDEHDGNIIDIQNSPMAYGITKIIVVYKIEK